MSDSGAPAHWPFNLFDPASFKVPARKITRVFLHCTASDLANLQNLLLVEEVNRWHQLNGWRGVGYHYLIDKLGAVMTGRNVEETPAAQLGPDNMGNVATIAISTHGLWEFTVPSLNSVIALCLAINRAYQARGLEVTFHGHKELDPRPCPVYDYVALLGLDAAGHLFASSADPVEIVAKRATVAQKLDHPEG